MWNSYAGKRLKAIRFAFRGMIWLIRNEASIQVQSAVGILVTLAGFFFKISPAEWMIQTLAIGLVISLEGINTAIEKTADFVHPQYHKRIGVIKDIAAGSVFIAALTAIAAGSIIYFPKIMTRFAA